MKTLTQSRSPYWDTLKGLLILLVILGHCGTALSDGLLSVIYSFHMPLFVFISGYFSKKTASYKRTEQKTGNNLFVLQHCLYIARCHDR